MTLLLVLQVPEVKVELTQIHKYPPNSRDEWLETNPLISSIK
jgi:hypothetical protein